ncbi:hypothetical protein TWF718_009950 [Orbilia javanica]|uniref:Secreted protein n=1 Tax=Orbilia javanica TaxID=47235 RepID=A0AAN8RAX0_9PEZI
MLSRTILPFLTLLLLSVTTTTNAEPAPSAENAHKELVARGPNPDDPPLCRLHAEWVMIAKGGKPYSWPYDQIKMNVWVKNDTKANWSGWPADANLVLTNFEMDREKGEWLGLTEGFAPDRFSSTCGATEQTQCWTDVLDRPRLRASPQHAFRDSGWHDEGGAPFTGNRFKMRDYVHFYWGPVDALRAAWHTDDNGKEDDMYIRDIRKNPYCRLSRNDAAKGVSWQYYVDGGLHVYVNDMTQHEWALAEGWDIECLFFCPI